MRKLKKLRSVSVEPAAAHSSNYEVRLFAAVLKSANYRSLGLLRSLGFQPASRQQMVEFGAEPDEAGMVKLSATPENAA